MTVLTMVQLTCDMLSLPRPSIVFGSEDQNVRTLLALLKEELEELHGLDQQRLMREHTFVTVADPVQPDAQPADMRRFISGTFFNRTTRRPLIGPITPQEWQAVQAQPAAAGVYIAWRERDDSFLMTPTPPAGQTIAYEYITTTKALSSSGVEKTEISADSDTILSAESLARLGLRWRWKAAKGLDYAEDLATYERKKHNAMALNGGPGQVLSIGVGSRGFYTNIPDGDWA